MEEVPEAVWLTRLGEYLHDWRLPIGWRGTDCRK